ncbi:MAG: hypothetical protein ACI3WU_04630 [Phascolarctobacterium sp.]
MILLELVALVGLLALSGSLVFLKTEPLWQQYHKQQLRFCTQLFAADLRQLQQEALFPPDASLRDMRVNQARNGYYLTIKGTTARYIRFADLACEGVYFANNLAKLSFSSNGAPSVNGYYRLRHKELDNYGFQVDVQPITGRVLAYEIQ